MNRREFAVATAGTVALGGCLDDGTGQTGNGADDVDDEPQTEPPFEIATIDAPGSDAGTAVVPRSDHHLLVNFTRA